MLSLNLRLRLMRKFLKLQVVLGFQALSGQFSLMQNINEIEELIKLISKLPGLGTKSAKRIVLKLINNREEIVKPLTKALAEVYKNISRCKLRGTLTPTPRERKYAKCTITAK